MTPHAAKVLHFPPSSAVGVLHVNERPCEPLGGIASDYYATRRAILFATALGALFWALLIAWLAA